MPAKKLWMTSTQKREFLQNLFISITTNASNYYSSKQIEAIAITISAPVLNQQVEHKKMHIILTLQHWWKRTFLLAFKR